MQRKPKYGMLCDYETGDEISRATLLQRTRSRYAARLDGGCGVILVDESGYVVDPSDVGEYYVRRCWVRE